MVDTEFVQRSFELGTDATDLLQIIGLTLRRVKAEGRSPSSSFSSPSSARLGVFGSAVLGSAFGLTSAILGFAGALAFAGFGKVQRRWHPPLRSTPTTNLPPAFSKASALQPSRTVDLKRNRCLQLAARKKTDAVLALADQPGITQSQEIHGLLRIRGRHQWPPAGDRD